MTLFSFIYLPFTLIVTLTFWPGFNPLTVAVAEFLEVDVFGFALDVGVGAAFAGTFAAASLAAVAIFAATVEAAAAFVASVFFVTDSALTATTSAA
jgi:hypothetical protein